jgi:hypothetical protein
LAKSVILELHYAPTCFKQSAHLAPTKPAVISSSRPTGLVRLRAYPVERRLLVPENIAGTKRVCQGKKLSGPRLNTRAALAQLRDWFGLVEEDSQADGQPRTEDSVHERGDVCFPVVQRTRLLAPAHCLARKTEDLKQIVLKAYTLILRRC